MIKNILLAVGVFLYSCFTLKSQTTGPTYIKNFLTSQGVFNTPNFEFTSDYDSYHSHNNIKGLFMEGLDYFGDSTKVFCWYGIPETLPPGETAPAMILVHGGGGNAYTEWVRKWTDKGYIAISIALEGQVPNASSWAHSGPIRAGFFNDVLTDLPNQWFYHAVADIIMANSLLRSFPEVDSNNIGITGISWGGILTNVVTGIDNRFKFAIPVYGCGYLYTSPLYIGILDTYSATKRNAYLDNWEPSLYIPFQNQPTLFVNGTNDFHFSMNAFTSTYKAFGNEKYLRIEHNMLHGHRQGWKPEEIYEFADYITKGTEKPLVFTSTTLNNNREVSYQYDFSGVVNEALLYFTTDTVDWQKDNYKWTALTANLDTIAKTATVQIPDSAVAYFMNINDISGDIHSSVIKIACPAIACDDGDPCTMNDVYDGNCNCTGTLLDNNNNNICDIDECVGIELYVYLEGTFDSVAREMTTRSIQRGVLPGQIPVNPLVTPTPVGQPYHIAPWNYSGTEGQGWTDSNYTGNETDWILVSFRTGTAKNTEVGMTAALLMKDGSINFPDRCALPSATDALYVVIEHRNHIGIMSPTAISITNNQLFYDFRASDSYRDMTSFGQKQTPTGEWIMFAGDADQSDFPSYDINGSDKAIWSLNNGVFDYYFSPDFNLDGDINGADKSLWFNNNGISSRVPK